MPYAALDFFDSCDSSEVRCTSRKANKLFVRAIAAEPKPGARISEVGSNNRCWWFGEAELPEPGRRVGAASSGVDHEISGERLGGAVAAVRLADDAADAGVSIGEFADIAVGLRNSRSRAHG